MRFLAQRPYLTLPLGGAGCVLLVLTAVRSFALSQGGVGAGAFVACALLLLAALAMALLRRAAAGGPGLLHPGVLSGPHHPGL